MSRRTFNPARPIRPGPLIAPRGISHQLRRFTARDGLQIAVTTSTARLEPDRGTMLLNGLRPPLTADPGANADAGRDADQVQPFRGDT